MIECNYKGKGMWYTGKIVGININTENESLQGAGKELSYDIDYEDDEKEYKVSSLLLRPYTEIVQIDCNNNDINKIISSSTTTTITAATTSIEDIHNHHNILDINRIDNEMKNMTINNDII